MRAGSRRAARLIAAGETQHSSKGLLHAMVEHTSINPNKAAHIATAQCHPGDTFVRLLRAAGKSDVQNYIDNTGVQVPMWWWAFCIWKASPWQTCACCSKT